MMRSLLALTAFLSVWIPLIAQSSPAFEVAAIKLANSEVKGRIQISSDAFERRISGDRFVEAHATLHDLIMDAYKVRADQISGGLGWAAKGGVLYNIEAKIEDHDPKTADRVRLMLRSLLEERFHLKVHLEMKEMPAYELSIARSGHKLRPLPTPDRPTFRQFDILKALIANALDHPLIDKTGLSGDFEFDWDAGEISAELRQGSKPAPSVFSQVQQQLGLKLDLKRQPTEIVIIDSAEKPSAN